jgi:phage gpG-like protein
LQKKMEASGAFGKAELNEVLKEGSVTPWLMRIAHLAEQIVSEAFQTGGFGKWPAWRTPGYTNDHNRLLEDTGQLRDAITSEVK